MKNNKLVSAIGLSILFTIFQFFFFYVGDKLFQLSELNAILMFCIWVVLNAITILIIEKLKKIW